MNKNKWSLVVVVQWRHVCIDRYSRTMTLPKLKLLRYSRLKQQQIQNVERRTGHGVYFENFTIVNFRICSEMFGHLAGSFANAVISKLLWLGLLFDFAITGLATPLSEPSVKKN